MRIDLKKSHIMIAMIVGSIQINAIQANTQTLVTPIWSGDSRSHKIALTFDDGPKPEHSTKILDILNTYGIKASFFVVGKEAKTYPDMIVRMHEAGHEICNHTYSHERLDSLTDQQLDLEFLSTNQIVKQITGQEMKYFRPPGGRFNLLILEKLTKYHLQPIMWNVNGGDFVPSISMDNEGNLQKDADGYKIKGSQDVYEEIIRTLRGGSIILLHNGSSQTIEILPKLITYLRQQGYTFVTISQLLDPKFK